MIPSKPLNAHAVAKPWGVAKLPPPFQSTGLEPIGEIWFERPPILPDILVKYIFTSEKLSVQVHPSDAYTEAAGLGRQGKEECWLITEAAPGASIAIGFKGSLEREAVRAAALDGSIEHLLTWHPVSAGDFFYIPAGTVHAIGAGVSLIEVQQASEITYRLYDYGRPRELHLDQALSVAKLEPYDLRYRKQIVAHGSQQLVSGPYFDLHYIDGSPAVEPYASLRGPLLLLPLEGHVIVADKRIHVGECALANGGKWDLTPESRVLLAMPHMPQTVLSPVV
jgi:mannose-6-phosphate isomerase